MNRGGRKSFRRKLQVSCGIRDYRGECASSFLHENIEQKQKGITVVLTKKERCCSQEKKNEMNVTTNPREEKNVGNR